MPRARILQDTLASEGGQVSCQLLEVEGGLEGVDLLSDDPSSSVLIQVTARHGVWTFHLLLSLGAGVRHGSRSTDCVSVSLSVSVSVVRCPCPNVVGFRIAVDGIRSRGFTRRSYGGGSHL